MSASGALIGMGKSGRRRIPRVQILAGAGWCAVETGTVMLVVVLHQVGQVLCRPAIVKIVWQEDISRVVVSAFRGLPKNGLSNMLRERQGKGAAE